MSIEYGRRAAEPKKADEKPKDPYPEAIISLISRLEPHKDRIRAIYTERIDPTPVCGWLAMFFECKRRKWLKIERGEVVFEDEP